MKFGSGIFILPANASVIKPATKDPLFSVYVFIETAELTFKPDKMANSEQERSSPTPTLDEQPEKESQEHTKSDTLYLTPSKLLGHWFRMDKAIATVFSEYILKVILFGFNHDTITFPRRSGLRLGERTLCANSGKEDVVSTDIVRVSQFPKWRINRIEKLVTQYLKGNGWDVREVNVFWDEDETSISVKWDYKLPEESDEEANEASQEPAEKALLTSLN